MGIINDAIQGVISGVKNLVGWGAQKSPTLELVGLHKVVPPKVKKKPPPPPSRLSGKETLTELIREMKDYADKQHQDSIDIVLDYLEKGEIKKDTWISLSAVRKLLEEERKQDLDESSNLNEADKSYYDAVIRKIDSGLAFLSNAETKLVKQAKDWLNGVELLNAALNIYEESETGAEGRLWVELKTRGVLDENSYIVDRQFIDFLNKQRELLADPISFIASDHSELKGRMSGLDVDLLRTRLDKAINDLSEVETLVFGLDQDLKQQSTPSKQPKLSVTPVEVVSLVDETQKGEIEGGGPPVSLAEAENREEQTKKGAEVADAIFKEQPGPGSEEHKPPISETTVGSPLSKLTIVSPVPSLVVEPQPPTNFEEFLKAAITLSGGDAKNDLHEYTPPSPLVQPSGTTETDRKAYRFLNPDAHQGGRIVDFLRQESLSSSFSVKNIGRLGAMKGSYVVFQEKKEPEGPEYYQGLLKQYQEVLKKEQQISEVALVQPPVGVETAAAKKLLDEMNAEVDRLNESVNKAKAKSDLEKIIGKLSDKISGVESGLPHLEEGFFNGIKDEFETWKKSQAAAPLPEGTPTERAVNMVVPKQQEETDVVFEGNPEEHKPPISETTVGSPLSKLTELKIGRIRTVESVGAVFNLILPKHQPPFTEKENEGQRRDRIQKQIEHVLGEVEGKASDFERQFSGNRWQFQVYQRAQEALNSPLSVIEGLDFSNQANVDAARKKIKAALEERITSSAGGDYREKLSAGIGEKNQQAFDTMLEAKAQWHLMLSAANAPQEKGRLAVVTERLDTTATLMSKIVATKGFLEDDPSFKEDLYKLQTGTSEFETFLNQRTIKVQEDLGLYSKIDKDGEKLFVITSFNEATIGRIIEEKSHQKKIIWSNIPDEYIGLVEKLCLQQWKKVEINGEEAALSKLMPGTRGDWAGWIRGIRGHQDGAALMQQLMTDIVGSDASRLREFYTDLALHADRDTIDYVLEKLDDEQKRVLSESYSSRLKIAAQQVQQKDPLAPAALANVLSDLASVTGSNVDLYKQTVAAAQTELKRLTDEQKKDLVQQSLKVVEENTPNMETSKDGGVKFREVDGYLKKQDELLRATSNKKIELEQEVKTSEDNVRKEFSSGQDQQPIVARFIDTVQKHYALAEAFKLQVSPEWIRSRQKGDPQRAKEHPPSEHTLKRV